VTPGRFVRDNTTAAAAPLVPEIRLHLATEVTPLWHATAELLDDAGAEPPFWAFAWPGGQAVARYILDRPGTVAGKRVLDIASGGGIVAIAAAKAGAATVTANDTDAFAIAAIRMNAALNGVVVETCPDDLTARRPEVAWEAILAGDVFYDRAMAAVMGPWLAARARDGATVLLGDPGRAYLPEIGLARLASYEVPTSRDLEAGDRMTTAVWTAEG
jgi:predicted nicotinamide N-methyase